LDLNVWNDWNCSIPIIESANDWNQQSQWNVWNGPQLLNGAWHRVSLEARFLGQKAASKLLNDAFYVTLLCEINQLRWSDPGRRGAPGLFIVCSVVKSSLVSVRPEMASFWRAAPVRE
jgi:hypothetical protein